MKKVYFIGIGGIGISALARCFLSRGWQVSGSDVSGSEIIRDLEKEDIKISLGVKPENIKKNLDLVVYTVAVKTGPSRTELKKADKLGIKTKTYAQALGELTKDHFTIAVSGSHGKSTTTSMLSLILIKAGLDPTVIVGTKLKEFGPPADGSNFRAGKSKYLVIEADEWNKSFLNYWPKVIVLTNIDKEHLDTYGTEAGVVKTFSEYVNRLPKDGILIANWQDKNSRRVALSSDRKVIFYDRNKFPSHKLQVPGRHNQLNAEAAWQAARTLGVKKSVAAKALHEYKGAWRRLEKIQNSRLRQGFGGQAKFKIQNLCVYSDYAHHPAEIRATLAALRDKHPKQKIVCIFQPHQADRLTRLFSDFKKAFEDADELILLPVYKPKGRELLKNEKTSFDLYKALSRRADVYYCESFSKISKHLNFSPKNGVFVFMSAGDLDNWLREAL